MATNRTTNPSTDLFMPRKALTAHLEKLVAQDVIRGVAQAEDLADVLDGKQPANHAFAYVTYDKSKQVSTQGKHSIRSVQTYTIVLAWQNNRPVRSGQGHGMDEAGEVLSALEFYLHGYKIDGDYASASTGSPFMLSESSPEAFYRSGGWAFYPLSFDIPITRIRPTL